MWVTFFQNCKNNKPQPTDLENNTTETTVVQEDLDTSNAIPTDTLQTEEKVSEEMKENVIVSEEVIKPIEKEVEKVTEKDEKTTANTKKEETDPVTEDTVEEVVETVVETNTIEDADEKEVEIEFTKSPVKNTKSAFCALIISIAPAVSL